MFRLCPLWLLLLAGVSQSVFAGPLHICVDKNPLPPFVYSEKINGAGQLRGYSLDLIKQVLKQAGAAFDVKSLSKAEIDKNIQSPSPSAGCDVVLDVRKGSELEKFLLLSPAIYQLNYDAVYDWERFMTGIGVKTVADLNKMAVCGIEGYDYGSLAKQIKIKRLGSIKDAMFEIKHKECDVFVAEAAVMKYGQRANAYQVPPVGCVRLDGTVKTYHFGVARHVVGGDVLMAKIQQQLAKLSVADGFVPKLVETYDILPMSCQARLTVSP